MGRLARRLPLLVGSGFHMEQLAYPLFEKSVTRALRGAACPIFELPDAHFMGGGRLFHSYCHPRYRARLHTIGPRMPPELVDDQRYRLVQLFREPLALTTGSGHDQLAISFRTQRGNRSPLVSVAGIRRHSRPRSLAHIPPAQAVSFAPLGMGTAESFSPIPAEGSRSGNISSRVPAAASAHGSTRELLVDVHRGSGNRCTGDDDRRRHLSNAFSHASRHGG